MISWFQDLRYAIRQLRKSPGFTLAAVLTLAMAIGSNAVVFSVMNGLILRPLNVPAAKSLYGIERAGDEDLGQSYPDYLDVRDRNHSFDGVGGYSIDEVSLDTGDKPSRVWGMEATGNYFDVLRIQPYLGRFFHASDEHGPEQRSSYGSELRVLAQPLSRRSWRAGPYGSAQPASVYHHRRSAT